MSKTYVCDSCNEIIKNPHDIKMKEFYIGCSFDLTGVYPSPSKRLLHIHLCDKCFLGLNKIAERILRNEQ